MSFSLDATQQLDDDDALDMLLDEWEAAAASGESPCLEELCSFRPHLLPELKRQVALLQLADRRFSEAAAPEDRPSRQKQAAASSDKAPPALDLSGRISGLAFHDQGALGVVYCGTDETTKRRVAVKFTRERIASDSVARAAFALEAEITSRLEHPGVVPLYAIGRDSKGRDFYVMRFIEGRSYDEEIDEFHRAVSRDGASDQSEPYTGVRFARLLRSFVSVCHTVAYAHNRGVVHRDLKPANIRLGRYGETVVLDWGLAIPVQRDEVFRQSHEMTLLPGRAAERSGGSSGPGVGTPAFMAPEQASGLLPTPAADIYSLGATLYKVLTGSSSMSAETASELKDDLINGRFRRPREVRPRIPEALEAICLKAMALHPNARYATAKDLADDVERFLADAPVSAHTETITDRLRRWARNHPTAVHAFGWLLLAVIGLSLGSAVLLQRTAADAKTVQQKTYQDLVIVDRARSANLRLSALSVARTVADDIDRRWRLMETETNSETLRRLLTAANAEEGDSTSEQLQHWLLDRKSRRQHDLLTQGDIFGSPWAVLSRNGQQVARSPRARSLGRNFGFRDYFHGKGLDLPEDIRPTPDPHQYISHRTNEEQSVYKSQVFRSSNNGRLQVGFTVAVWDKPVEEQDRSIIGLMMIPQYIRDFDLCENSVLFQLREDPFVGKPGLILAHPALDDAQLPIRRSSALGAGNENGSDSGNDGDGDGEADSETELRWVDDSVLQIGLELQETAVAQMRKNQRGFGEMPCDLIPQFRDPVTGSVHRAAIAPILIPERNEEATRTNWCIIVLEDKDLTAEPGI